MPIKKKSLLLMIICTFVIFLTGCSSKPVLNNNAENQLNEEELVNQAQNYELVKEEDLSIKAIDKPLSSYSSLEIENLPLNLRKEYRILVASEITKEELEATFKKFINEKTNENKDIDEIVVLAYDNKNDINDAYTYGKAEWCPNGKWGEVSPDIALSNNRESYKFNFQINDKVGNLEKSDKPSDREIEIYNELKHRLNRMFDDPDYYYVLETDAKMQEYEKQQHEEVCKKYNISLEELDEIYYRVVGWK